MKRFWKNAEAVPSGESFGVELDGRPVKLPSGNPLITPLFALAHAIAIEWANAPQDFSPEDLALTRLASTAQERIALHRADIIHQLVAYGMNDLLCYRADSPDGLVARQDKIWGPWLRWAETIHGVHLLCTTGLVPIRQSPSTGIILREVLSSYDDNIVAALGVIVPALGSLILGLALAANALNARAACDAAFLEEIWQEEQWGTDEAAAVRRANLVADVELSTEFMRLCTP